MFFWVIILSGLGDTITVGLVGQSLFQQNLSVGRGAREYSSSGWEWMGANKAFGAWEMFSVFPIMSIGRATA